MPEAGDRPAAGLAEEFRGDIVAPADPRYDDARKIWNGSIDRRPALIARPRGVADVVVAVRFAREHDLLVAVRGGGHSIAGHSTCDDGLVIDLGAMKGVWVDPAARRARVQPGVVWRELDRETQEFGLAVTGGLISSTGVAGFTLGGGIGYLHRSCRLACDNLVTADVVTAHGSFVRASEDENPDLLWAVRGGGGNFGIVASFELALHPVGPQIVGGLLFYAGDRLPDVLGFFRVRSTLAGCHDGLGTCALSRWTVTRDPIGGGAIMPHANEDTLRKLYDALGSGDVPTVLGLFTDDVRFHVSGRSQVSGDYVGKSEILGFLGKLMELSGGTFRIQVLDVLANDEHGVVLTRDTAQHDGKTLDNHAVHVWDMRAGTCTRFRGYNEDAWDEF